jgi:hypothetical protein
MANITEYFERLQKLTQTNCEILKTINDAFYSKSDYLTANVDGKQYVVPSFMSLDNKINALTENFNNLVYAPKTGEATFNFDGASKTIELKGYSCTPDSLSLTTPTEFNVEQNQIFKDFLNPSPYLHFDITSIPNDLNKVVIKKVVAHSDAMKSEFKSLLTETSGSTTINHKSINKNYEDLYKVISLFEKDVDYIEYDTIKSLPIRKTIGTGLYTIKSIDKYEITPLLTETYTLTLKEDLKYKLFDNTIEKYLQVGDELLTYDNSAKMKILEVRTNSRQIVVEVVNGEYVNLVADNDSTPLSSDLSKLKFYSAIDFKNDKYINVPLEEDQYVAIFIAPLNERMNIRAPWGTGVLLNTYLLEKNGETYSNFYNTYINNVGDILYELTSIATNNITKYSEDEFNVFSKYKPQIAKKDLTVYQINTHLNNSPTVQKIRSLHNQKIKYNSDLNEIQKSIDNINSTLASVSFDNTTNIRSVYESQLTEYNKKRNEIVSAITSISNELAMAANDSEVPIENAKYHIRGFFVLPADASLDPYRNHINGIKVWYRYKNRDQETGNAHSIGSSNIFSDWNEMPVQHRLRVPRIVNNKYEYHYIDNSTVNEPSYNQIDIPISQGETVDIKLQVLWDFGFPYLETSSDWSEVINIEFPEELTKDVQILDIITENNNDIETNRFNNILKEEGIITHVGDKLIDQDSTYFHQPEHIASGFYTAERRVIPLKDKLMDLNNEIVSLKDEVFGYNVNNLRITTYMDDISTVISPNQENTVYVTQGIDIINLQLTNISQTHSVKLYPIIIGSRNAPIDNAYAEYYDFKIYDYTPVPAPGTGPTGPTTQVNNQYIYFRATDKWTGEALLPTAGTPPPPYPQYIYPFIKSKKQLCTDSDSKFSYTELRPSESIIIPIQLNTDWDNNHKTIQLTLRLSLYEEPITYEVTFTKSDDSMYSIIKRSQIISEYNSTVR